MKIQCDVCHGHEAAVFCVADEAALCAACDRRVHHANKLAGKHQRFSINRPSPNQSPLCDICQEKRAFLFCQQDRALLCKDCDVPIHKANEHTQKHTRFLLTGVEISPISALPMNPASPASTESQAGNKPAATECTHSTGKGTNIGSAVSCTPPTVKGTSGGCTSSFSEYLMETLPGWHVEDFLDSPSPCPSLHHKNVENDLLLPVWDNSYMGDFPTENMGVWVPESQTVTFYNQPGGMMTFGTTNGIMKEQYSTHNSRSSKKRNEDNCFAVPQMTAPSIHKRSRIL